MASLWLLLLVTVVHATREGYLPPVHKEACLNALRMIDDGTIDPAIADGVGFGSTEPDDMATFLGTMQMTGQAVAQVLDFGKLKVKYDLMAERVAAQAAHGGPLPLQWFPNSQITPVTKEQEAFITSTFEKNYVTNNRGKEKKNSLAAYVTNKQVRNQLVRTAEFRTCMMLGLSNDAVVPSKKGRPPQATRAIWRHAGVIGHLVGDTYSASHNQRRLIGTPGAPECFNNVVDQFLSMDVVSWVKHRKGDETKDWRFDCYQIRMQNLLRIQREGVKSFGGLSGAAASASAATTTQAIRKEMCEILKMQPQTVDLPAGGAPAPYSSAVPLVFGKPKHPVMPVGLAPEDRLLQFVNGINNAKGVKQRTTWNSLSGFAYPSRASADICSPAYTEQNTCEDVFKVLRDAPDKWMEMGFMVNRPPRADDVPPAAAPRFQQTQDARNAVDTTDAADMENAVDN